MQLPPCLCWMQRRAARHMASPRPTAALLPPRLCRVCSGSGPGSECGHHMQHPGAPGPPDHAMHPDEARCLACSCW
ncbi:hypothetical protein F751_0846 [Auxenochlorella protothecoides]|uniref:Uncharacterized protein n=1 Tax=Auxenochlorella protothecoides TaxID=3075 RepID=A0A087SPD3_AUXPR|nr:hypothetical protein F751_0846 [Auxenochlorella protothecoides]KFM27587.1 hypothetical protein F751_0846 [Auxenochlorella protothecoides]